ncbi:hypothetical protein BDV12DRAFT_199015 [Aspergillus spectabilis]
MPSYPWSGVSTVPPSEAFNVNESVAAMMQTIIERAVGTPKADISPSDIEKTPFSDGDAGVLGYVWTGYCWYGLVLVSPKIGSQLLTMISTRSSEERAARECAHRSIRLFLASSDNGLDELRDLVDSGKLRTVVGTIASLTDVEAVQEACQVVYSGRGGIGKMFIKVVNE